jgi:hypothetical protein
MRKMVRELIIYDADDSLSSHEAKKFQKTPQYGAWSVAAKGIRGVNELGAALNEYSSITQLSFCTHGSPGAVYFKKGSLKKSNLATVAFLPDVFGRHRNYESFTARLLFMGCQTAKGKSGKEFLIAAGKHFFKGKGGGIVGGTTNSNFYPYFGGTRVPGWGKIILIKLDAKGNVVATKTIIPGLLGYILKYL